MKLPQKTWQGILLGVGIASVTIAPLEVGLISYCHLYPYGGKTNYRLMVSPTFTTQQQEEIRHAAHKWEHAVHNPKALTITVQVGACPADDGVVEGCLLPTDKIFHCGDVASAVGCTTGGRGWNYARVDIDVACGDIHTFSHIAQHEIGHVLGVFDTDSKGVVMHRSVDCSEIQGEASQDVSQSDVNEYMKLK